MRIEIRGRGLTTSDGLRARLERRLAFALGRFAPRIGRVRVRLEDVNGPRGGVDKRCRLEIAIHPDLTVVVEEPDPDLYAAIDRAAERAGRAVARELQRWRTMHGSSRTAPGTGTRSGARSRARTSAHTGKDAPPAPQAIEIA